MSNELKNIFLRAIDGDTEAVEYMLDKFKPKISYYAKKLDYEEAKTDMVIIMLEFIKKTRPQQIDDRDQGQIVNFILSALCNGYRNHMKKLMNNNIEETVIDTEMIPVYDKYENIEKYDTFLLLKGLTGMQRKVIIARYVYGYKCIELAQIMGKSKQVISKTEQRALEIIKKNLNIGRD